MNFTLKAILIILLLMPNESFAIASILTSNFPAKNETISIDENDIVEQSIICKRVESFCWYLFRQIRVNEVAVF